MSEKNCVEELSKKQWFCAVWLLTTSIWREKMVKFFVTHLFLCLYKSLEVRKLFWQYSHWSWTPECLAKWLTRLSLRAYTLPQIWQSKVFFPSQKVTCLLKADFPLNLPPHLAQLNLVFLPSWCAAILWCLNEVSLSKGLRQMLQKKVKGRWWWACWWKARSFSLPNFWLHSGHLRISPKPVVRLASSASKTTFSGSMAFSKRSTSSVVTSSTSGPGFSVVN